MEQHQAATACEDRIAVLEQAIRDDDHVSVCCILDMNPSLLTLARDGGATWLHVAAENASGQVIEVLIRRGVNVNEADERGATPLHHAAGGDRGKTIETLIRHGASVYARDANGATPLHYAARISFRKQHDEAIVALLKHGAAAGAEDSAQRTALDDYFGEMVRTYSFCAFDGLIALMDRTSFLPVSFWLPFDIVFEWDSDWADLSDWFISTIKRFGGEQYAIDLLHFAIRWPSSDTLARQMIGAGIDPNALDSAGLGLFHSMVADPIFDYYNASLDDLRTGGADRNVEDAVETISALRAAGADIETRDRIGQTALGLALGGAHYDESHVAAGLILNGARVELPWPDGQTVYHRLAIGCPEGYQPIDQASLVRAARFIHEHHASISVLARDDHGRTAEWYAEEQDLPELAAALRELGRAESAHESVDDGGSTARSATQDTSDGALVGSADVEQLSDERTAIWDPDLEEEDPDIEILEEGWVDDVLAFLPGEDRLISSLAASVRSLLRRDDVTPHQVSQIGRLLFALQRLPNVTPGLGLALRIFRDNSDMTSGKTLEAYTIVLDQEKFRVETEYWVVDSETGCEDSCSVVTLEALRGQREDANLVDTVVAEVPPDLRSWCAAFARSAADCDFVLEIEDTGEFDPLAGPAQDLGVWGWPEDARCSCARCETDHDGDAGGRVCRCECHARWIEVRYPLRGASVAVVETGSKNEEHDPAEELIACCSEPGPLGGITTFYKVS